LNSRDNSDNIALVDVLVLLIAPEIVLDERWANWNCASGILVEVELGIDRKNRRSTALNEG
jgi:hypothetical protein